MKKVEKERNLYLKLLKFWVKGKSKKAIKLQHKLLKLELDSKDE